MTVVPESSPALTPEPRPELRLVPPEAATETTGPVPVIRDESDIDRTDDLEPSEVTPQAPLDVRLLESFGEFLAARPRWSQRAPSSAEIFEYSTSGDWTAEKKSIRRTLHSFCVLAAFILTYPIEWAIQAARQKPIGFALVLAVLFLLGKVL